MVRAAPCRRVATRPERLIDARYIVRSAAPWPSLPLDVVHEKFDRRRTRRCPAEPHPHRWTGVFDTGEVEVVSGGRRRENLVGERHTELVGRREAISDVEADHFA